MVSDTPRSGRGSIWANWATHCGAKPDCLGAGGEPGQQLKIIGGDRVVVEGVLGAGVAGLYQLYRLQELGLSVR